MAEPQIIQPGVALDPSTPDPIKPFKPGEPAQNPDEIKVFATPDDMSFQDDSVILNAAKKYHFGLGEQSPGEEQLAIEARTSKEPQAREFRSKQQDIEDVKTRQAFAQALAATKEPGQPLSDEEMTQIRNLSPQDYEEIRNDPATFYEKKFAKRIMQTAIDSKLGELFPAGKGEAGVTIPTNEPGLQVFMRIQNEGENLIARQQVFQRIMEEREAKWGEHSMGTKALNFAEGMMPFINIYQLKQALGNDTKAPLPGDRIEEALDYLWTIPIQDAATQANRLLDALEARNPMLAVSFARALMGQSTNERFLNNSMLFADVGVIASPAMRFIGTVASARPVRFANAVKDIVKGTSARKYDPTAIVEATGNYGLAGQMKGMDIIKQMANLVKPGSFETLKAALPSGWDISAVVQGDGSKLVDERARRIADLVTANRKATEDALGKININPLTISRLDPGSHAEKEAVALTNRIFNIQFPGVEDRILGVSTVRQTETLGGMYQRYEIGARAPGEPGAGIELPRGIRQAGTSEAFSRMNFIQAVGKPVVSPNYNFPEAIEKRIRELWEQAQTARKLGDEKAAANFELEARRITDPYRRKASQALNVPLETGKFVTRPKGLFPANENMAVQMGHKDATLFDSVEAANWSAKNELGISGYQVKQRGAGYYIEYHKAIDERATDVFTALEKDTDKATPRTFANTILGIMGNPLKRVSQQLEADILTATYGKEGLMKLVRVLTKPISDLKGSGLRTSRSYRDLQKFMSIQQSQLTDGHQGKFSRTIFDLDADFYKVMKRFPTIDESVAYFATTDLSDSDYWLRSIGALVDKTRNGAELHGFAHHEEVDGAMSKVRPTPFVEGKALLNLDHVWTNPEDAGMLVWHPDRSKLGKSFPRDGDGGYFRKNWVSGAWKTLKDRQEYIEDLLKNKGYRVIQLSHWGEQELRKSPQMSNAAGKSFLDGRPINYVITKDLESAPLDLHQFPYRPGIHKEYPNGHFISQPNVRIFGEGKNKTAAYYGDTHYMYHPVEKDAKRMTELLNEARKMMNAGDPNLASFWSKNLPGKVEDFTSLFEGKEAIFDKLTPFFHKHTGSNVANEYQLQNYYRTQEGAQKFLKATDSTHNLYGNSIDLRFLSERNATLRSFKRTGDIENPAYHWKETELIKPFTAVNRAFGSLIRDQYLGDLKAKAAQAYVAEFGHLLDTSTFTDGLATYQRNPYLALASGQFRKNISGADQAQRDAAINFRRATMNFLGIKSDWENKKWAWKQDIVNLINETFPNAKMTLIEPWLLHKEFSGLNLAKNVAFHTTQGFFNPASMVLHASVMTWAQAVEGYARGFKGMAHAFFMGTANFTENPKTIDELANLASKFGIDKEHWKESYSALKRSGFGSVGGEHMLRDTWWEEPVIANRFGKFGDFSAWWFNKGVQMNRYAAWNMAYDRWRTAYPKAIFDNAAQQSVLQRADALSGSMSRASAAQWQKGWFSVPTQFLAYSSRILETLWGRDLPWQQKLAFAARYSAVYGLPSTGTTLFPIWPWHKAVNQTLQNNGIYIDDNMVAKFFNDGALGLLAELAAGERQTVSERFGSQGGLGQYVEEIVSGKKTVLEAMGGPSGYFEPVGNKSTPSLMWDTLRAGPLLFGVPLHYAEALLQGKPMPNTKIQVQQIIDAIRSMTVGNRGMQVFYAHYLGQFISRNEENLLEPYSAREAWIDFVTGLRPQKIDQMYDTIATMQARKDAQKKALDWADRLYRTMLRTSSMEDQKELQTQWQIAIEAAGLNAHEKLQYLKRQTRATEDKYSRIMEQWGLQSEENYDFAVKQLRDKNGNNR